MKSERDKKEKSGKIGKKVSLFSIVILLLFIIQNSNIPKSAWSSGSWEKASLLKGEQPAPQKITCESQYELAGHLLELEIM